MHGDGAGAVVLPNCSQPCHCCGVQESKRERERAVTSETKCPSTAAL